MHEEPLHLVPLELRPAMLTSLSDGAKSGGHDVAIRGDLCPFCRQMYMECMAKHAGDWAKMLGEVKVYRLIRPETNPAAHRRVGGQRTRSGFAAVPGPRR